MTEKYDAHSIKVLKGLDAVKKRPGMYIGDVGTIQGIHNMLAEVIDNSVDEGLAGFCQNITIELYSDKSVKVTDDGRGIPISLHKEEGVSAAEVIMTQLHAGGKFDNDAYKVSGGLHGVGVSVVNALSSWLELTVWQGDHQYQMTFANGVKTKELAITGEADGKRGTSIRFLPSAEIFAVLDFDYSMIENRIRELAFLNSGIAIFLIDRRSNDIKKSSFCFDGGIEAFTKYLDRSKKALHKTITMEGCSDEIDVQLSMEWNDSYSENVQCFTNNIRQGDGGTHLAGFRAAITRTINLFASENFKKNKIIIQPEDIREGLTAVLSIKVPDPKFSSQTKDKLVSTEVKAVVEGIVSSNFLRWLEENPSEAKLVINRIVESAVARDAARKAKDLSRKKGVTEISSLPGKLANCQEKDPTKCELFLVEGNSAGGTAKQGRDRNTQAILPLKGKILNVEKARFDKVLNSPEICSLISALGTGVGKDDFDISKLKYHKVIIMTDADVDGAHIRTLLMTFFYRYMTQLIENGHVYIAQPPLYKVRKGQNDIYLKDESDLNNYLLLTAKEANKTTNVFYLDDQNNRCLISHDQYQDLLSLSVMLSKVIAKYNEMVNDNVKKEIIESVIIQEAFLFFEQDSGSKNEIAQKSLAIFANSLSKEGGIWSYLIDDNTIIYQCDVNGVITDHKISIKLLDSLISRDLKLMMQSYTKVLQRGICLEFNEEMMEIKLISKFADNIFEQIKKSIYIQRFKGLGEMNSDQLWETTLNPQNRDLKQLAISDARIAEEVFSMLMGDVIEPRRDFIQENAPKVVNLDA